MLIIGLCGGSGSGKGAVSRILRESGIPGVDTDLVYREITSYMSACLSELVSHFGDSIVKNGALDRRALASIVFSDPARLELLNKITHKHILARTRELLAELCLNGEEFAIIEAPLLFESGFDRECDITVAVLADAPTRLSRIVARDGITECEAQRRIASQHTDEWLAARVDEVVYNNGDLDELRYSVTELIEKIKNTSMKTEE